jgi:hypothetical protein
MEDIHISTDAMGTATPAGPNPAPASTPPAHKSPIDQTRDAAKKVLAMITGRAKS